jgi:hypothetical protein
LTKLAAIFAFGVLLAGCGMAGPGIARSQPAPAAGVEHETTYDSSWVKPHEPDAINTLNPQKELSADISKRQLGVRYFDEDTKIGEKHVPAYEKRQQEREEARRKAWQARTGLKTIKDEQEEREGK